MEDKDAERNQIEYVKPEILDLGLVEPIYGLPCADGNDNTEGCTNGGMAKPSFCSGGSSAGPY